MKRWINYLQMLALLLIPVTGHADVYDLSDSVYNVPMSSTELNAVQDMFLETQTLNPSYISETASPNLYFTDTAQLSVTFIDEGAGYKNTFGFFTFDENNTILETQTIFSNASKVGGGGTLGSGDTVDLGTFNAEDSVGFWLQANGYNDPNGATYYTIDELNPDRKRHVAIVDVKDSLIIGIEDLFNLGDKDYNDILFKLSVSSDEAINKERIPGSPAPGASATAFLALLSTGILIFRKKRRG